MNSSYFTPLTEAAELLKNSKVYSALEKMRSVYEQKLYFVAFIGQYSAGKSSLLNRLLKRQLLPEGVTETTPRLTYIRSGETEEAVIHYLDGAFQIIDIEQVSKLSQQNDKDRWDLDRLEYLEIFLKDPMLNSGMIMLDTPGVNSLIEKHERLLDTSLSLASEIVYVAGGAPSAVDAEKLSALKSSGFDVTYVRTRCDEIKEYEESLEQAKDADQTALSKCGIEEENCYYVSNIEDSELFPEIDPLRDTLTAIGSRSVEKLEANTEKQLKITAEKLAEALNRRSKLLEQILAENNEKSDKYEEDLVRRIKKLESQKKIAGEALNKRVEACVSELNGEVTRRLDAEIDFSGKHIADDNSITNENEMKEKLGRQAADFLRGAESMINAAIDPLISEINGSLTIGAADANVIELPDAANYIELIDEQDEETERLYDRLNAIRKNKEEYIAAIGELDDSDYTDLVNELSELENAIAQSQNILANYPPYIPQTIRIEDSAPQPSQVWRKIGNALDWLLLAVPGAGLEKAFTSIAKIPSVAKNFGKLAGTLEKVGKAAKSLDPVKDVLYTVKKIDEQNRPNLPANIDVSDKNGAASVLDYITIEYWMEKFGANFDKPTRYEIDREYESRFQSEKKSIEENLIKMQKNAYKKKIELNLFKNEADKKKAQKQSLEIDEQKVLEELKKREKRIRAEAEKEGIKKWRQECVKQYVREMKNRIREIINSYTENVPQRLEEYLDRRFQTAEEALEKERQELLKLQNAPKDETAEELERINKIAEEMNNVFN